MVVVMVVVNAVAVLKVVVVVVLAVGPRGCCVMWRLRTALHG